MEASGFDLLGAESSAPTFSMWGRNAVALMAGAVGAALVPSHPVLAFLDTAALVSNVQAVVARERSWKNAVRRMGRHVVASAGSLALPKFPAVGWVAGAIAGDLLINDEEGGIIEELAPDVLDAEVTEVKSEKQTEKSTDNSKAIVKVDK